MTDRIFIKNCHSEPWKQCYCDLRLGTKATETAGMAASTEYLAAPWDVGGGGVLGVLRLGEVGRNPSVMKIKGHKGTIQDVNFSPFYNSILATASEDLTIRVWDIPEEPPAGLELRSPVANLQGSTKKVTHCEWNRVADFVLASCSFDGSVRLWNVESQAEIAVIKADDHLLSLKWSAQGSLAACTCKNKSLFVVDPREGKIVQGTLCHEGAKPSKCIWLDGCYGGGDNCVLTTGFSKIQERELKIFDLRKMTEPKLKVEIDRSSQPLYPFFDESLGMVFVAGKGDGTCRYFQYHGDELKRVDEYRSTVPIKSMCFVPKMSLDFMRCEVSRMLKNENGKTIVPVSFIVPRKSTDTFHKDLYPPTPASDAALTADQWFAGQNGVLETVSPEPGGVEVTSNKRTGDKQLKKSKSILNSTPAVLAKQAKAMENERGKLQEELEDTQSKLQELKKEHSKSVTIAAPRASVADTSSSTLSVCSPVLSPGGTRGSFAATSPSRGSASGPSMAMDGFSSAEQARQLQEAREAFAVASSKLGAAEGKIKELEKRVDELQRKYETAEREKYKASQRADDLASQLEMSEKLVSQQAERLKQLEEGVTKSGGAFERAATLQGLDATLRAEITEMRDFFREVLCTPISEG